MVLDIILGAVLIIAFLTGVRQGFVKSVWKLAAWIITGIAVYIALEPVVNFMSAAPLYDKIYTSAYDIFSKETAMVTFSGLPEWLGKSSELTAVVNENTAFIAENAAAAIADIIIKAISAVGLFVVIRLVLSILFRIINIASRLPVINGVNKLLGGVFSLISIMICVYLILALASFFANTSVYGYINESTAVKYLFNNNILMKMFM